MAPAAEALEAPSALLCSLGLQDSKVALEMSVASSLFSLKPIIFNGCALDPYQTVAFIDSRVNGSEHEELEFDDGELPRAELLKQWQVKDPEVTSVDPRDVGTPDAWVKRNPDLVRLTGRHPFNCEAPLPKLMEAGFCTPAALHYVRNHGLVPQVPAEEGDTWTIQVTGLVKRPQTITVAQIKALPKRTLPVTLVCAGNRRKEENMVKQTIGFNWGAAGVSNSVWTGARLSDVLKMCGILPRSKGALFVGIEGAEHLPGGGGTKYGTSLQRERAMDDACDIILAYEQNGKPLEPDHGFPIRVIIPGYIGGRMVKWLRKIEVTEKESSNHYHYNDNRVLPSHVDAEKATAEGWWFKPEYIINELNINSAISSPAHGEVLPFNAASTAAPYTIKGYAYTGGGRQIIRVEISLNNGASWQLCDVQYHEKPTAYGKFWCWVFWSLPVDVVELMQAKEIVARAWDAGQNTQPQHLTWNVMGMMNNCWFRVKIDAARTASGELALAFQHPTRPGNESGGWMVKQVAPAEVKPETVAKAVAASTGVKQFTMEEVKKHDNEKSAWLVIHNKVYDATPYLEAHPGGSESILINAGTDATEEFDAIHSQKAKAILEKYYIGDLFVPNEIPIFDPSLSLPAPVDEKPKSLIALNLKERIPMKLSEKIVLSPDTRLFRFALQSPQHILGLPVGKHMFLSVKIDGKLVMRAYTPTSSDDEVGYFDLVVKVYFENVHPAFPGGGVMSQHLESLAIGDTIDVKGPTGHVHYTGKGTFLVNGKPKTSKRIAMLAGGTGITPMYQVLQAICKDKDDDTEVFLVYCNNSEQDILLRADLDRWAAGNKNLHVWYTIGEPVPAGWKYGIGRLSYEMAEGHLPPGSEEAIALMCGPPPMLQYACIPHLTKLGYAEDRMLTF